MVFIFIEGANALSINHYNLEGLALVGRLQELCPAPETLGAGVDRWSHAKATHPRIYDHSIEQEGFAGPVLSGHSNDTDSLVNP